MAYDPAADLPRVRCPVLAITGSKDLQVDPEDVSRIGVEVSPFDGEILADLTHVLRRQAGLPVSAYRALLRGPVDAALLDRIALRGLPRCLAEVAGDVVLVR